MALDRTIPSTEPVKAPKQVRKLVNLEEHVVETAITRKDGTGNLFKVIIDLGRGTAQLTQSTSPFTAKSPEDIDDVIEFFQHVRDTLASAPAPVTGVKPAKIVKVAKAVVSAPPTIAARRRR